jgi:hypothetical protein
MTNLQKYSTHVATSNRRQVYGFPSRRGEDDTREILLNQYMILHGLENDSFTEAEAIVMQNIFDSISVPD